MSLKDIVIGVVAIVGLVLGGIAYTNEGVVGSASSPSVVGGCTEIEGVQTCYTDKALTTATTTVCAIKSPVATSTLVSGGIRLDVSSTTASTVTVAKATTQYATTTLINSVAVGANARAAIIAASTTVSALEQTNRTFAPNTFLVFGMAGGTGTFSPSGACSAVFQVL